MDAAKSTIEKKKKKTLTLPVDKLMNFIIQKVRFTLLILTTNCVFIYLLLFFFMKHYGVVVK